MVKRSTRDIRSALRLIASTCTASINGGQFCDRDVPKDSPVSMCALHLMKAFRYCESLMDDALSKRSSRSDVLSYPELARERMESIQRDRVVYYAQVGQHIKIGTTAELARRMQILKPDALLATEPGYFDIEKHRHRQFAHLRVPNNSRPREYFEMGEDLMEHIADLVAAEVNAVRSAA